jgi:hypothetical protein
MGQASPLHLNPMPIDRRQVEQFVASVLKHGTPDWVRFPRAFKAMVDEWHKQAQEALLEECEAYKVDDQELLADPRGRRVNMMSAASFMAKLRGAGLTCFSHDSPLADHTASLFVLMPSAQGGEFKPMCSIQVPLMWEWSLLRIDPRTNLPTGFRDIGWRSAVLALIRNGALNEWQAHAIFGKPREASVSKIHRRMLFDHRNRRNKNNAAN